MPSDRIATKEMDLIIINPNRSEFYIGRFIGCRIKNSSDKILKKD